MEEVKNDNREMTPSDEPIKTEHDDVLGWKPYAQLVAKALFNPSSNDSMVYAIDGPWGSGKSSLLNLIGEQLAKLNKDKKADEKYTVIVNYRPWNVALDQNAIIKEFFDVFVRTSKLGKTKIKTAAAKALLYTYAVADAGKNFCETFPNPATPFFKALQGLIKPFTGFAEAALQEEGDLSERKAKLEKELSKQTALRFLVVVDDLDRLNRNEIRLVVQLIKAVGNLPNVSYLLAIDWNIVAKALDGEQTGESGTGESYLSKIVQNRIPVPPVDVFRLTELVEKAGNKIFERYNEKCDWSFQPLRHYVRMISSLREAKKYIRSLDFYVSAFGDSINPSDLATIVAIKMLDPMFYELIVKYHDGLLGLPHTNDGKKQFIKELLATRIGQSSEAFLLWFFDDLFPNFFGKIRVKDRAVTNNHLSNPDVLDRFQQLTIYPNHRSFVNSAKAASLDADDFANWCLQAEEMSVKIAFYTKVSICVKNSQYREIADLVLGMFHSGVSQSMIDACIESLDPFFKFTPSDLEFFASELLAKDGSFECLRIVYQFLTLRKNRRDMYDREIMKMALNGFIEGLMKTPMDLFKLPSDCILWAIDIFDSVKKYIAEIKDEELIHRLLLALEMKDTGSNHGKEKRKTRSYGISKIAVEKFGVIKPFIGKWITNAKHLGDLTVLIPIAMRISDIVPDKTLDGIDFYNEETILAYTMSNFPDKVEDLKEAFNR